MRLILSTLALFAFAAPVIAEPPATAVVHPTIATAAPLARAAAAARDYRVYLDIGLGVRSAPGLACANPQAMYRLGQRGWNEIPDTSSPPHTDTSDEAARLFNRTLAVDKGFQAATSCRPLSPCETRFGPIKPEGGHWRDRQRDFRLDRQCLSHPGQLIAAVQSGSLKDIDLLLVRAPQTWRQKDARGRDVYDWALLEAARQGRRDAVVRLLPKVSTGRVAIDVPERSIEAAMVLALAPHRRSDAEEALAIGQLLRAHGARLTYGREVNVSLISEVLANSSAHGPERLRIVDWLLAIGADPNGPPCSTRRGEPRGFEPLRWALEDEPIFNRLVAAGADAREARCKTNDGFGGQTLTWHAIRGLENLGPGFEERRRIAIKLLKMGGRVSSWSGDPISVADSNLPALSIMAAAAQFDGVRDRFLMAVIAGSAARPGGASAAQQARVWLACPHREPVLLADRALLCDGET